LDGADDGRLLAVTATCPERGTMAMTTAAAMLAAKYPAVALMPSQMAPAAPGKETTARCGRRSSAGVAP